MRVLYAILLIILPSLAYPHGGGLDTYGCHHDRKAGGYHCHRGPNTGKSYSSKEEMLQSLSRTDKEAVPAAPATKPDTNDTNTPSEYLGKVVGVTDGDTLTLLVDQKQIKIYLSQIDTPESGQPYGSMAKQALSDLAFGKEALAKVEDIDRYGRTVARVFVGNTDVNAELVRQGAAWIYRKYATDDSLYKLETEARDAKRGLWALPEAERTPPWEWRQSRYKMSLY